MFLSLNFGNSLVMFPNVLVPNLTFTSSFTLIFWKCFWVNVAYLKKIKADDKMCTSIHQNRHCFPPPPNRYLGFLKRLLRRKQEKAQCWDLKIWGTKDTPPTNTCWGCATACWGIRSRTTGKIRLECSPFFWPLFNIYSTGKVLWLLF